MLNVQLSPVLVMTTLVNPFLNLVYVQVFFRWEAVCLEGARWNRQGERTKGKGDGLRSWVGAGVPRAEPERAFRGQFIDIGFLLVVHQRGSLEREARQR